MRYRRLELNIDSAGGAMLRQCDADENEQQLCSQVQTFASHTGWLCSPNAKVPPVEGRIGTARIRLDLCLHYEVQETGQLRGLCPDESRKEHSGDTWYYQNSRASGSLSCYRHSNLFNALRPSPVTGGFSKILNLQLLR